jgi:hypothetical protein
MGSIRDLIKTLEAEIAHLKGEISKREGIISQIASLGDMTGTGKVAVRRGRGRPPGSVKKGKRGRGRPPGKQLGKQPGRRPGRPPGKAAKKAPVRRKYNVPVGDMIADVLKSMKQPALQDDLAEKVHKKYPSLGGVKYRAIVSSIVSRDPQFKRIGKDRISLK